MVFPEIKGTPSANPKKFPVIAELDEIILNVSPLTGLKPTLKSSVAPPNEPP
ncbi:MAG: hypothetical protein JKY19_06855 [Alcanivoracaceae bacterium]|nr:hypothetical protein [Alcanivoracaceae bacterium]